MIARRTLLLSFLCAGTHKELTDVAAANKPRYSNHLNQAFVHNAYFPQASSAYRMRQQLLFPIETWLSYIVIDFLIWRSSVYQDTWTFLRYLFNGVTAFYTANHY
jgi:hypothetical protein